MKRRIGLLNLVCCLHTDQLKDANAPVTDNHTQLSTLCHFRPQLRSMVIKVSELTERTNVVSGKMMFSHPIQWKNLQMEHSNSWTFRHA